MTKQMKRTYRLSAPIRILMALAAGGTVFFLAVLLVPVPLPYWIRAVCVLQMGLILLFLGCLCRLIWAVLRKR